MAGRIMGPQDIHVLIPRNWICHATWQKGTATVIKLRLLGRRHCSGLSGWARCKHNGLYESCGLNGVSQNYMLTHPPGPLNAVLFENRVVADVIGHI